ncbi:MAG: thermonuclease family protein [Nitrospirota bacterium]
MHPISRFSNVSVPTITLVVWALSAIFPAEALAKSARFAGIVMRIHDGDTISVSRSGSVEEVHLAGVDCPELGQAFGAKAKRFTERVASGQMVSVRLEGRDEKGRTLGVVTLPDGRSLNRELVSAGLAWKVKTSKNKTVTQLEKDARRAKRGLWSDAAPTPPWEYRKAKSAKR